MKVDLDKMYLFPRELDFDSWCTELISNPDMIINSETYDHPAFCPTVSIKVQTIIRGRKPGDGAHTRNVLAIPSTFVGDLRGMRRIIPP